MWKYTTCTSQLIVVMNRTVSLKCVFIISPASSLYQHHVQLLKLTPQYYIKQNTIDFIAQQFTVEFVCVSNKVAADIALHASSTALHFTPMSLSVSPGAFCSFSVVTLHIS